MIEWYISGLLRNHLVFNSSREIMFVFAHYTEILREINFCGGAREVVVPLGRGTSVHLSAGHSFCQFISIIIRHVLLPERYSEHKTRGSVLCGMS